MVYVCLEVDNSSGVDSAVIPECIIWPLININGLYMCACLFGDASHEAKATSDC